MTGYIDIHTHTYYQQPDTLLVLNVFPHEPEKLLLPVYCSAGLHPWHVEPANWKERISEVEKASTLKHVIAVGETGLDKAVENDFLLQQEVFVRHIEIAASKNKPMVIHCVRSYSEMLGLRKKTGYVLPWIFHWFNADGQTAKVLTDKNCFLSFGNMLFKPESKACRVFSTIDPAYVFLETDDTGYSIQEVYERAAMIKNMPLHALQNQIKDNFARCFHL